MVQTVSEEKDRQDEEKGSKKYETHAREEEDVRLGMEDEEEKEEAAAEEGRKGGRNGGNRGDRD